MADINNGQGYAPKLDRILSGAYKEWWNSLSKEEILAYVKDQPSITADSLRSMFSEMECILAFDTRFSATSLDAATDFHTK